MEPEKQNKYIYGWKFYVNYGQGWEYENFETDYKMMKENKKAYELNCDYPLKINRGRELNNKNTIGNKTNETNKNRKHNYS